MDSSSLFTAHTWSTVPANQEFNQNKLTIKTSPSTDFWRKTHYDFIRDNGHFYYTNVIGNFEAVVAFKGYYKDLYD